MRGQIAAVMCCAVLAFVSSQPYAIAQQKSAKACRQEWQANKAANQANGVTEKAYVAQCRGGSTATQPEAAPAEPTSAPKSASRTPRTTTGEKTAKACREEWRANKAANQARGVTEKAYVDQCRAGATAAEPTTSPATPSAATPAPETAPRVGRTTGQKTVNSCREEWRANKATNQANGVTERAYVEKCRADGTAGLAPVSWRVAGLGSGYLV
jgi:hypothetical protein